MRREKCKPRLLYLIWTLLLVLMLAACTGGDTAVSNGSGIPVAPEFAAFYTRYGGVRIFGAPITEAFPLGETGGLVVQYFQSIRLDYDRTATAGEEIAVYPLGEWALTGVPETSAVPGVANGSSRLFPETGYAVQDAFLALYESYQGEQIFGPPLSPQISEGDLVVQYFRNARLEWRLELPFGQQVQVSQLGQAHFDEEMVFVYQEHVNARPIVAGSAAEENIGAVRVTAEVGAPILYAGETQVVYVTVQHEDGRPVAAVRAELAITTSAQQQTLSLADTGSNGRIQEPLDLDEIAPGEEVQLTVTIYDSAGDIIGVDTVEFRTWW